jgi:hypothetical protein
MPAIEGGHSKLATRKGMPAAMPAFATSLASDKVRSALTASVLPDTEMPTRTPSLTSNTKMPASTSSVEPDIEPAEMPALSTYLTARDPVRAASTSPKMPAFPSPSAGAVDNYGGER